MLTERKPGDVSKGQDLMYALGIKSLENDNAVSVYPIFNVKMQISNAVR